MLSDKLFNLYRLQGPHPHIKIESETAEDNTLMIIQVLDDHLSLHLWASLMGQVGVCM